MRYHGMVGFHEIKVGRVLALISSQSSRLLKIPQTADRFRNECQRRVRRLPKVEYRYLHNSIKSGPEKIAIRTAVRTSAAIKTPQPYTSGPSLFGWIGTMPAAFPET